jgi:cobalt-zinc-cadmium efflux system protein
VRAALSALPGVADVHHLHIWAMSTTETALTAHLVAPLPAPGLLQLANTRLGELGIGHVTLQIEQSAADDCGGHPCSESA